MFSKTDVQFHFAGQSSALVTPHSARGTDVPAQGSLSAALYAAERKWEFVAEQFWWGAEFGGPFTLIGAGGQAPDPNSPWKGGYQYFQIAIMSPEGGDVAVEVGKKYSLPHPNIYLAYGFAGKTPDRSDAVLVADLSHGAITFSRIDPEAKHIAGEFHGHSEWDENWEGSLGHYETKMGRFDIRIL
ncbi:hypothetical protein LZ023_30875 [Pseudomonas silvicola]|nr:hypothetical protein LZ023_30875 [Pseudomonas silvicola]